ncbi:hypothetical protein EBT25_09200 [bacterium]|jgi:hypothetical protein|nr:hypothetical protein [bacterium]
MSYVVACWQDGIPHAITANKEANKFELIPLDSDVALNKILSLPYRAGAQQILKWINSNDEDLACKELSIQDEARFRK